MTRSIRGVFFDFDGLILDTELPEVVAWSEIYFDHGCEFPDWCWRQMIGQSTPESGALPLQVLEHQIGRPIDRDAVKAANLERRLELILEQDAMPGVLRLIAEAAALGLKRAVVSSSSRKWVEGHLDRLGILAEFDAIVCGGEGHPSKPDPSLYRGALRLLDLGPKEVIALEDSPSGIQAAKDAGIYCVAVPNALTKMLILDNADRVLPSLDGASMRALMLAVC